MLLVIDNYDSFVYNLVQYFGELGTEIEVVRNDKVDLCGLEKKRPERIVLSPGPGCPEKAGVCIEAVAHFSGSIPVLGICLGHQCIGRAYGAMVKHSREPVHGKTSFINHEGTGILQGLPPRFKAARYHSLVVEREGMPGELAVTAHSDDGTVMALQHTKHPTFGLQFHPESAASEYGMEILRNFLNI